MLGDSSYIKFCNPLVYAPFGASMKRIAMSNQHYLGALQTIRVTLRYVALYQGQWVALISFSSLLNELTQ